MEENKIIEENNIIETLPTSPTLPQPLPTKRVYTKHTGEISTHILKNKNGYIQKRQYTKKKYISPEAIEEMKAMLTQKIKRKDICERFNITLPTLKKYTW